MDQDETQEQSNSRLRVPAPANVLTPSSHSAPAVDSNVPSSVMEQMVTRVLAEILPLIGGQQPSPTPVGQATTVTETQQRKALFNVTPFDGSSERYATWQEHLLYKLTAEGLNYIIEKDSTCPTDPMAKAKWIRDDAAVAGTLLSSVKESNRGSY